METTGPAPIPWLVVLAMPAAAGVVHWGLRRIGRRLPIVLARRAGTAPGAPLPYRNAIALSLLPVKAGLWLAVALFVSDRVGVLHVTRDMATRVLSMRLRAPLFTLGGTPYALLDLVALPVTLVVVWAVVQLLTHLFKAHVLATAGVERGAQETVVTLMRTLLVVIGSVVVLQTWGLDVSSLTMVASVFGVGIGFGLQNIANNFVSGLLINFGQPVKPGDFLDVAGFQGTVERVGSRSTQIRTLDHVTILVPNSRLLESEVVNWSHGSPVSRLHVPVGVAYGSNIARVREALLGVARSHSAVLADPRPRVEFRGFGASALEFELLVWTADPRIQRTLTSDLNYRIEAALRRHGIQIPFSQHDLHVRSPQIERLLDAWSRRHLGDDLEATPGSAVSEHPSDAPDDVVFGGDLGPRQWSDAEIDTLVARMRATGGVDIRDRRHLLAVYPRCFVGGEVVTWLVQSQELTRQEATALGQQLIDRAIIHHVLDEHGFKDGNLFYRFYADEQTDTFPATPSPSRAA